MSVAAFEEHKTDAAWQARVDLAAAYRLAAHYGWSEGICNHFTLTVPGHDDRFLLIPYGLHWSEVTASTLIEVDFEGNLIAGEGEAETTAFCIHAPLHRQVPQAACVLHTHQPNISAFAAIEDGTIEPVIQSSIRFHGRIAYDDDYTGLALDSSEGDRLAGVIGDKEVLLMRNHGVIVVGPTVAQAVDALYYLDRACELQLKAMSSGRPLKPVSDNMARHANQQMMPNVPDSAARHFEALKRLLDRVDPGYER